MVGTLGGRMCGRPRLRNYACDGIRNCQRKFDDSLPQVRVAVYFLRDEQAKHRVHSFRVTVCGSLRLSARICRSSAFTIVNVCIERMSQGR
jgi:hypothetical protein